MGSATTASGIRSIAMGFETLASGQSSTAIGVNTTASGFYSTAMGFVSTASGQNSTVMGYYNTSPSYGETVLGIGATTYTPSTNGNILFRTANATDRLLVVGNAIDANNNGAVDAAERSNALTILKNGDIKLGNKGTYLTNVQEGAVGAGGSATVFKEVLIIFPTEFTNAANVRINVQAVNDVEPNGTPYTDQFLVTVKQINTAGAVVIVRRMDGPTSWGQNLQLHWMAWE